MPFTLPLRAPSLLGLLLSLFLLPSSMMVVRRRYVRLTSSLVVRLTSLHIAHFQLLPSPPEKDGRPIEMPSWSSPVRLPQDMWPGRYVALYSTKAFFTLPVTEEELFVSAKGAAYSGLITIEDSNSLSDDEWAKLTNHKIYDQMVIEVESRFTEQWLRDGILVRMMQRDHGKGVGLGIYSGSRPFYSPSQFISYHVTVHLPVPKWRKRNSESLRSNTSLIPHVSVNADNMRLAIESLWGRDDQGWTKEGGVYFKTFESQLLNSGLQIARALVASESVTLVLQNGPMRDISADGLRASIVAPSIDVETRNGPIWLTNILASENITLRTGAGGINVTGGARAPLINVRNHGGYIGGCYRAEHLTVTTENGDVDAAVWLTESDGDYDLDLPGDVVGDGKVKNKWSKVRTVEVDSKVSGTHVRYIEQDRSIELHSRISSRLGTIVVEHAPGFQGSWNASTNVGHLTVEGPSDEDIGNGRRIVTDAISEWPVGHWGRGRVWWGDKWHEWKMKGFSHVSSGAGSIRMSF